MKDLNLAVVDFDGCVVGVRSLDKGQPILKPWRVATSSGELLKGFVGLRCNRQHDHAKCEGRDAVLTGMYTHDFAAIVHGSWELEARDF